MKYTFLALFAGFIFSHASSQTLTEEAALRLARLPLRCINTEFPNKTSHTADSITDAVLLPSQLHPSFYGCLDWHSSVHGHWLLVKVLKMFPSISIRDSIIQLLSNSFQTQKIEEEAEYFSKWGWTAAHDKIDVDLPVGQITHPPYASHIRCARGFILMRFLDANRYPLRWKTLCFIFDAFS